MKIKQKLVMLFLIFLIVPSAIISILIFTNLENVLVSARRDEINVIADLKKDKIEHYFTDLKGSVRIAQDYYNIKTNLPIVTKYSEHRNDQRYLKAKEMLDRQLSAWLKVKKEVSDIYLVSPDGKVVYCADRSHILIDLDARLDDMSDHVFEEGKKGFYLSGIFKDKRQGPVPKFRMLAAAPIYSFDNKFIGEVVFEINMVSIFDFIQESTGLGRSGETLIVEKKESLPGGKDGPFILFLNTLRHDPGSALNRHDHFGSKTSLPAQLAATGENGSGLSMDYRGKKVLAAWRYMPSLNWGLVTKMDNDEALDKINAIRNIVIIICILTVAIIGLVMVSVLDGVVGPIKALHKGTEIIGSGDLDYKVGTSAQDEIGQLSRAFDEMTGKLKRTMASRDELNRVLSELNKNREWLQTTSLAVEQNPASIVVTDPNGSIEYVNPKFIELTGYTLEEVKGKTPRILKSGKHSDEFYKQLWATITSGPTWRGEFHDKKKNGELYWETASISPIKDKEGKIINFVAVKEDITERKQTEAKVEEQNKQIRQQLEKIEELYKIKSDFTSTVSHELRTPLTAIKEGITLVADGSAGALNDDQRNFLSIAKNNVDRLNRLINDVLDFSKLEAKKMPFNFALGDISAPVKEGVASNRMTAEKKGLEIAFEAQEGLPQAVFDQDRIFQVVNNLIGNAIKFTEKGGIKISLGKVDEKIKVCVSDTGKGISTEDLPRLFVMYSQLGGVTGRKTGGTGLGLAISKQIIEQHGGAIWAESERGKGSRFCFTVPLKGTETA